MHEELLLQVEEELENFSKRGQTLKRLGIFLMGFSYIFFPILISMIVINIHSNKVITESILAIVYMLLTILSILFITGLVLFIFNIRFKIVKKIHKFFKYLYLFSMTVYTTFCITMLILLYGPVLEVKELIISQYNKNNFFNNVCEMFYNKNEINMYYDKFTSNNDEVDK